MQQKNRKKLLMLILVFLIVPAFGTNTSNLNLLEPKTNNTLAEPLNIEKNGAAITKDLPNIKDIIPLEDKKTPEATHDNGESSPQSSNNSGKNNTDTNSERNAPNPNPERSVTATVTTTNSEIVTPSLQQDYNLADKEIDPDLDSNEEDVSKPPSLSEATIYDDASPLSDYPSPGKQSITQINRYATVTNKATKAQINPLNAIAQFKFTSNVKTIGDAIHQVLQNTSYKLVSDDRLPALAKETLAKPLPVTVRTLGPISIKNAVLVLIGEEVFTLQIDLPHRLINFKAKTCFALKKGKKHKKKRRSK